VLGGSTKGDAGGGHAPGADAGAAANQLVDVDPHLAIVRALPLTPAAKCVKFVPTTLVCSSLVLYLQQHGSDVVEMLL